MSEPCTARIKNQHSDERCVLEAGHEDPEYGTEHGGPEHPVRGRLRWSDSAVGAVPHQPAPAEATEATDVDTCRAVEVDGETVRFRGSGELTEEGKEALGALVRVAKAKFVAEAPEQVGKLQERLRLAHKARRAKEHQLDGIRRALCDAGFMEDDDPYGHADLEEVIRQAGQLVGPLLAEVAAARKFAGEMRDFCSPHGVSVDYADRLEEAMDRAKEGRT
jgi:hypothetical protein